MQFDWKHLVALLVGFGLSMAAAAFHIDFSQSCPPAPASATAVVAAPSPGVK